MTDLRMQELYKTLRRARWALQMVERAAERTILEISQDLEMADPITSQLEIDEGFDLDEIIADLVLAEQEVQS